jgi:hypothetical protein
MKTQGRCTIGDILNTIEGLKKCGYTEEQINELPVYIQRIEDSYFESGGWRTNVRQWGVYQEDTSEYIAAFTSLINKDENGNLEFCIDAHY